MTLQESTEMVTTAPGGDESMAGCAGALAYHDPSNSATGWIFSCYAFFLYFCRAQGGSIFDVQDIKVLIMPGTIGTVASGMFQSVSFALALRGVVGGISASLSFNFTNAVIGHWFSKRRGLTTGIACTAGGLGGVAVPPDHPTKAGAAIDLKALPDIKYGTVALVTSMIEFAVSVPYTLIRSYSLATGVHREASYQLNTLLNVGAIPGRVLRGYVADRFGTCNTMSVTAMVCTGRTLSGAAISLTPVCIGEVYSVEDHRKRTGTVTFLASIGALVGVSVGP
ncbi:hypothetical protein VUR80DRAFT_3878 [Thermomyces stellatus]